MVNQILGLLSPTSGTIEVLGEAIHQFPERGRYLCSVQPQGQLSLGELTPRKAVTIRGLMRGGNKEAIEQEVTHLFETLDISEWVDKENAQLSGGVERLTSFCMSVINSRKIIILDEPTNDVDPVRRRYLWQQIQQLKEQGKGVIQVTHNIAEAEKIVDWVVILHEGKILAKDTGKNILAAYNTELDSHNMRFEYSTFTDSAELTLPVVVRNCTHQEYRHTCYIKEEDMEKVIIWARQSINTGDILDYSISETTLEDAYVTMTERRMDYAVC